MARWQVSESTLPEESVVFVKHAMFTKVTKHDGDNNETIKVALVWDQVECEPELPPFATQFTVGSGWEIVSGGDKVKSDKAGRDFAASSAYGHLIQGVLATDAPMAQEGYTGPGPDVASVWNNTSWVLKAVDIPGVKNRDGKPVQRMEVVKYLPPKGGSTKKSTATTAASTTTDDATGSDSDAEDMLKALAQANDSPKDFMKAVLADAALRAWVSANNKTQALTKGTLYTDLRGED